MNPPFPRIYRAPSPPNLLVPENQENGSSKCQALSILKHTTTQILYAGIFFLSSLIPLKGKTLKYRLWKCALHSWYTSVLFRTWDSGANQPQAPHSQRLPSCEESNSRNREIFWCEGKRSIKVNSKDFLLEPPAWMMAPFTEIVKAGRDIVRGWRLILDIFNWRNILCIY